MTTPPTLKTVSVLGMRLVLVAFLAATGHAQIIVEELRPGNVDAVEAALLALPTPDEEDLNGLLALMQAGKGGKSPAPEVAELAYAVIGWWSIQDAGVANGLLDRFENRDWPKLENELFELATIGATDGMQRAAKWYAGKDKRLRSESLRLLRCVGGDKRLIDRAIKETLQASAAKTTASKDDVARALHLMWEFQVASEDLRKLLEARVAASESWDDKMLCVWAMVRGGAFRTDWLMQLYLAGNADQRRCIDDAMVMAADAVLTRLINALPTLTDDASRQIVIDWLARRCGQHHVRAGLRAVAPGLDALGKRMVDVALASGAGFDDLLPHWRKRLSSDDPELQRIACLAIVTFRSRAQQLVPQLEQVLRKPQPQGVNLHHHAMVALAAIGAPAKSSAALLEKFAASEDKALAVQAQWALPMVLGTKEYKSEIEILTERVQRAQMLQRLPNWLPSKKAAAWATQLANGKLTVGEVMKKLPDYERLESGAVPLLLLTKARGNRAHWFDLVHSWTLTPKNTRRLLLPRLLVDVIHETPMTELEAGIDSRFLWGTADVDVILRRGTQARDRRPLPRDGDLRLLSELGTELQPALPLLQWLAPRRATWFRDVLPKAPQDKPGK